MAEPNPKGAQQAQKPLQFNPLQSVTMSFAAQFLAAHVHKVGIDRVTNDAIVNAVTLATNLIDTVRKG